MGEEERKMLHLQLNGLFFFQFLARHHPNWAPVRTHTGFPPDFLHINVLPMETRQRSGTERMQGEGERQRKGKLMCSCAATQPFQHSQGYSG